MLNKFEVISRVPDLFEIHSDKLEEVDKNYQLTSIEPGERVYFFAMAFVH